jgi:hypothetical protein
MTSQSALRNAGQFNISCDIIIQRLQPASVREEKCLSGQPLSNDRQYIKVVERIRLCRGYNNNFSFVSILI